MAINGDFFTLHGLATIAQEGQEELLQLTRSESDLQFRQKLIQDLLNKLDHLIGLFKAAEASMLAKLNAKNLNDLENRMKKFYSDTGYSQFVDIDPAKILKANFEAATNEQKAALREEYIQILENLLTEAQLSERIVEDTAFNEGARKAVLTKVSELLRLYGFDSGNRATGKGGLTISSKIIKWDDKGNLSFFPELASSIVINRLEEMKRLARDTAVNRSKKQFTPTQIAQLERVTHIDKGRKRVSANEASINLGLKIGEITGGLKETDARSMNKTELQENNELIIQAILQQINPKYRDTARRIMTTMLYGSGGKDTMFYVGSSAAQLKGILGEIGTMHAVCDLLGLKEPSDDIIKWVASETSNGKQLSVDIVLKHFANIRIENKDIEADLGIQVKNVENDKVHFVDASMESIMKKLEIDTQHLENVFFSDDFNVGYEYNLETKQFVPMFSWQARLENAQEFLVIESMIDYTVRDIYNFLSLYSAEFLYMGLGDEFINSLATLSEELSGLSGNVLYIVRDRPFFASNMLIKIRQSVQNSVNQIDTGPLKIQAYISKLDDDKGNFNIISYLNSKGTENAQHIHEHTVKLKSSFLFK